MIADDAYTGDGLRVGVWFVAAVLLLAGLFAVAVWAVRAVRWACSRAATARTARRPSPPHPGGAPMSATELTRSDADENLDACRVRCHVCGTRVYVGETAP